MNWDDKSDDEVSVNLAKSLGLCVHNVKGEWLKYTGVSKGLPTYEKPDYCNSWADIGPLIVDHDICIIRRGDITECNHQIAHGMHRFVTQLPKDKVLRAAAICIIKKLEAKNESILTAG